MNATRNPVLTVHGGQATTTSLDVSLNFGKRHNDVLKAIRNLLPQLPNEHLRNFAEVILSYENGNGATQTGPAYRLTRDGFTLLAMGFTGRKALQFKLAYIDAFNRMEAALNGRTGSIALPKAKPAYMMEAWFALLKQQAEIMQRVALARAIKVSAPCLSQVLNGSGKYGNGQASTAKVAQRVACAFSLRLGQQPFTPLPTSQSTRAARRPERRRLGRGTPIAAAAI